jgi:hypothetical protein
MDNKEKTTLTLNKESSPSTSTNHARVEITLKLDNLPSKTQVNGKDTSFVVKDAKGHSYKVTCKTKTFNKSQKTIAGFKHSYVISCSTKEFSINGKHVDMNQSGMQVFEKVPKTDTDSTTTEQSEQSTES